MAECSYARCLQERRLIKRELSKWSKETLLIVGLERVAEEFMGRRQWKHYQEQLTRSHLNIEEQQPIAIVSGSGSEDEPPQYNHSSKDHYKPENHRLEQYHSSFGNLLLEEDFENNQTSHDSSRTPTPGSTVTATSTPSPPPEPNDWRPSAKCNFCVNGRLLTVNAHGELVAEATATVATISNNSNSHIHQLDSDSNSSASLPHQSSNTNISSSSKARHIAAATATATATAATPANSLELYKLLTQQAAKMTSMDSLAAKLAQYSLLADFNLMNSLQQQQQQQQQQHQQIASSVTPTTSEVSAAAISPALKDTSSPSADAPLDLSSKPSPNSSISGDVKSSRACATPTATGRRSYSEEDLNRALQDVVANKLGTRKAASQHHVPRSILVNRLHKMQQQDSDQEQLDQQDQDPEDSNEDEGEAEVDSNASTPAPAYPADFAIRKLSHLSSEHNGSDLGDDIDRGNSPKLGRLPVGGIGNVSGNSDGFPPVQLDAKVLMHTLMLAAGMGAMPQLDESQTVGELFKGLLVANSRGLLSDQLLSLLTNSQESNGNASLLLQQQQQQHQQQQQQVAAAYRHRLPKSETPETNSSLDPNEAAEDPILKIPSFKVSGPASSSSLSPGLGHHSLNNNNNNSNCSSNRNGSSRSPHSASPMLAAAVAQGGYASGNSLLHTSSSSIQKMMASNIQRQINEQSGQDGLRNGNASDCSSNNGGGGSSSSSMGYKKPSISVAKIIGGTDTSRFGASPNLLSQQHHHQGHPGHLSHHQQQQQQLSAQEAAALAAGKGTRPKRGKYRNYDRDSLVEAVKAVQRGEMSVHRAGSYYGVPHSTLEYKVKERHLMRPRKREPKPQPDLVGLTGPANKINLDKLKPGNHSGSKLSNALKNNSQAAAAAAAAVTPNGLKHPLFESAPHQHPFTNMFWTQTNATNAYGLDFNRMAEVMRQPITGAGGNHRVPMKSDMAEMAENMYDGIIRKTLQSSESSSSGSGSAAGNGSSNGNGHGHALLDQLLVKKTPLPFTNQRNNDYAATCSSASAESVKRLGSPLGNYADIKRERLSADSGGSSDEEHSRHHTPANNNNSDLAHNKNKGSASSSSTSVNFGASGNGQASANGNGRSSRMTSRDSETDASSLKSAESGHHQNHKTMDLNGSHIKCESEAEMAPSGSPILHEKLAQIKAEQVEQQQL